MEEDERINYPYYETTYFDDDNVKHIGFIKPEDLDFYKERFNVENTQYIRS